MVTVNLPLWKRLIAPRMEHTVDADLAFILENWHEVTPEQAASVAPYEGAQMWVDFWTASAKDNQLLRCDAFDYTTRQCTKYDTRPSVCRGFPWYDGVEKAQRAPLWRLYRCGYWVDIPREEWPEWVDVVELARQGVM